MASETVSQQTPSMIMCKYALPRGRVTVFLNNMLRDVWSYFWLKYKEKKRLNRKDPT